MRGVKRRSQPVMASHPGSPEILFGTMLAMVFIGACIPFALGRETVGDLEAFTQGLPQPA